MAKKRPPPRPGPIDKHRSPMLPHFALAPADSMALAELVHGDRDEVGSFIVALALLFNDLKGLVVAQQFLHDAHGRARGHEQRGQISGMVLQNARWTIGIVSELLIMVKEDRATIDSVEFEELVASVDDDAQVAWNSIVAAARDSEGGDRAFREVLVKCRNNISSHYGAKRQYARGLWKAFGEDAERVDLGVDRPAFSDGEDMEATRFYFADVAAKGATEPLASMKFDEVSKRTSAMAEQANRAIKALVMGHIRRRATTTEPFKLPHGWQWPEAR